MAQAITDAVIEDIKSRIDLGDLIASYGVIVRHAGSSLKACCPFHNEKTPSFNINVAKGFYHCFGCGESGDAIKFVMKQEGLSFVEAVKKLAAQCGIEIEERADPEAGLRKRLYALMAELAQFYRRCLLKMKEASAAREYLAKRRLDEKAQEDFLIGYAPNGVAAMFKWAEKYRYTPEELEAAGVVKLPTRPGDLGYHRFGGRLMFTVRDRQGRVVAFSGRQLVEKKNSGKYVNSPETPIFRKSGVLFGFDKAAGEIARSPHREVICCEGQIDTIRLHVCGFKTAVASQGTAFTEEHAKMIKRVADAAVLMYDDDAAGRKATIRVAAMLLAMEMPVRVVSLPDGDDPDSYLCSHPASDLQALIDGAESIVSFQCRVERAKERDPGSIDAVSRTAKAVLSTIASCPSAILRATLVDEAAKKLGLPSAAMAEELSKTEARSVRREAPSAAEPYEPESVDRLPDDDGPPVTGVDAASALPPPDREFALVGFLLANEYDKNLAGVVGAMLPPSVFSHDFTRRFARVWLDEATDGEDLVAGFADALPMHERAWFDRALSESGRTGASGLGAEEILEDFVRAMWCARLSRDRGALPESDGDESVARRLKISSDLKRLRQASWGEVREMVTDIMKGENTQWT